MTGPVLRTPCRISDFFSGAAIVRDGEFDALDEVNCELPGALAYCQTLQYFNSAVRNPNVACIVTTRDLATPDVGKGLLISEDPRRTFFLLYIELRKATLFAANRLGAIGEGCLIHPTAVIGANARIGDNVEIGANAVVSDNVVLGSGCYIGPNAVIGAEGLLTVRDASGDLLRVKHAGGVDIGPNVEILAGAIVVKSLFRAPTCIGSESQIGIMANVGHGAHIGKRCIISGNSVVAGRVSIGDDVWMGMSSCIAQGLIIGSGAQIKMGSVVASDLPAHKTVSGNFAVDHKMAMREHFRIAGTRR